ncbi:MAG: DUF2303 family protein [Burkholderiales bacterium]|jgi:uncharacterized protein YfdQ (DUF2303 family)|nr:DUF2303 family protein [Burkholderiales bacterium]
MATSIESQPINDATNAGALLAAGRALGTAIHNPTQDGTPFAVVPNGYRIEQLPDIARPKRPIANVKLRDATSFVRYVNAHKAPRSTVYASMEPARFLCVFDDYLHASDLDVGNPKHVDAQADWRSFRAEFTLPASHEWKTWTGQNRKAMTQLQFAEHMQDNLPDVIAPSGAELLETALNFEAAQAGHFVSAQRLQDGSHNLVWKTDNTGGTVRVPEHITLSIPVFENEAPRELEARLRYRTNGSALSLWYELVRPHKVIEAAFRETWACIEEGCALPLLLGSPE